MDPDLLQQISSTRRRIEYVLKEYNACLQLSLSSLSSFYLGWLIELLNLQGALMASLGSLCLCRSSQLATHCRLPELLRLPGVLTAVLYSFN